MQARTSSPTPDLSLKATKGGLKNQKLSKNRFSSVASELRQGF
jgi:hypothetical protein